MLTQATASDQPRTRINPAGQPTLSRQQTHRTTPDGNASTAERKAITTANALNQSSLDEMTVSPPCANALKPRGLLKRTVSMSSLITQRRPEMMRTSIRRRKTSDSGRSLRPRATQRSNRQTLKSIRYPIERHIQRTSPYSQMPPLTTWRPVQTQRIDRFRSRRRSLHPSQATARNQKVLPGPDPSDQTRWRQRIRIQQQAC